MKIYSIYKIDNHFKLFFNFKTLEYNEMENKITSDNFCISERTAKKILDMQNKIENNKEWGFAHYSYLKINNI